MLADAAYVRQVGNLPDDVGDQAVLPHLAAASARLRRWVGEAAYADAGAASPVDQARAEALKLAETHLALAELFTSLAGNYQLGQGFVGGGSLGEGSANYLTPGQVERLMQRHLAAAERLAGPYLLSNGLPVGRKIGLDDV
jgi:hypothetical protein